MVGEGGGGAPLDGLSSGHLETTATNLKQAAAATTATTTAATTKAIKAISMHHLVFPL